MRHAHHIICNAKRNPIGQIVRSCIAVVCRKTGCFAMATASSNRGNYFDTAWCFNRFRPLVALFKSRTNLLGELLASLHFRCERLGPKPNKNSCVDQLGTGSDNQLAKTHPACTPSMVAPSTRSEPTERRLKLSAHTEGGTGHRNIQIAHLYRTIMAQRRCSEFGLVNWITIQRCFHRI